jgi:hypothetical protein
MVLTGDDGDLEALASHADRVTVRRGLNGILGPGVSTLEDLGPKAEPKSTVPGCPKVLPRWEPGIRQVQRPGAPLAR